MLLEITGVGLFFIILGSIALIALIAFILYWNIRPKLKIDDKPTEDQLLQEEMNRILQPIEDDDTAKAVSEYKDDEE